MNTPENVTTSLVLLKDGRTQLASWSQDFESLPTVGDRIQVAGRHGLAGYGDQATISLVFANSDKGQHRIEAQAECELADHERPVVFLNSALFSEDRRPAAEECLRHELHVPLIHWEESPEPKAVLRLHENRGKLPVPLATLQTKLRDLAREGSALSSY
ncbi:hypothetical protein HQ447_19835 [bacterium]|nr:hypothetical protein [bacterium]